MVVLEEAKRQGTIDGDFIVAENSSLSGMTGTSMSGNTGISGHEHVTSIQDPNLGTPAAAPSTPAHSESDVAPASMSG